MSYVVGLRISERNGADDRPYEVEVSTADKAAEVSAADKAAEVGDAKNTSLCSTKD